MIQKSIGILADQIRGVSYKKKNLHDTLDENSVILLRANNIINGKLDFTDVLYVDKSVISDTQYLKYGDILISASSGSKKVIGKAASFHSQCKCTFGAFCKVIRPHKDVREFLRIYFQSSAYRRQISHLALGANINNIRNEHIDSLQLEIPNETARKQIVNKIDLLQKILTKKQQILSDLDELIKARFVEMFGDPVQNSLNKPMVKLESLGDWKSGGTPARSNPNFYDGNINWFSAGELDSLYLSKSKEKITEEAVRKSSTKLFAKGSMLIGMYDTAAFKMGILKEPSCANQACANIRANEKINVIWLYYELQAMKKYFLNQRHGVRQKNLTLKMIKQFEIPYFDLSLQNEFSNFVQQVDKSKFENIVYLNKTLSMKILGQLGDVFRD